MISMRAARSNRIKSGGGLSGLFDIVNYILLGAFFFLCLYPFYYVFIYSISDPVAAQTGITLFPKGITLSNYAEIYRLNGIANATLISTSSTVLGTCLTVVCCTLFAYLVSKEEMYCRKLIYRFMIAPMYISSGLIPWYLTMKAYHLNNNFLIYIIPNALSGFYVILLKTYIEQLPASLEESVKIDGGGYLTIFRKIIFPLSRPIIATIAVFAAVGQWNDWMTNYLIVPNLRLQTLQLILYTFLNQASAIAQSMMNAKTHANGNGPAMNITPASIRMTITMVVTLPIIFVYPFMQKYFVSGIMMGAIKG